MSIIDKFIKKFSDDKISIPDWSNQKHIAELFSYMLDMGIPFNVIQENISLLTEEDPKAKRKHRIAKQRGLKSTGFNNFEDRNGNKFTWNDDKQDMIPVSDDKEKETDKSGGQSKPQNVFKGDETQPEKPKNPPTGKSWADEKHTGDVAHDMKVDTDKEKESKEKSKSDIEHMENEQLRNVDHNTVDRELRLTKEEYEKRREQKGAKGVGAGTPESRAGECATHYALRKIKEGMDLETIKQELLSIASDKNTFLTKEWVNGALNCAEYVMEKYGTDNIEEVIWDTPGGRKLIDVENHGTSSDMFIKTKDGKRIGISLKKDGKVFIVNGGYDKQFQKLVEELQEMGLSAEKSDSFQMQCGIDTYNDDRKKTFEDGMQTLIDNKGMVEQEIKYFVDNMDIAKGKSKFGPGAKKYLQILLDNPGLDILAQKSRTGSLNGNEMKAISKLAKSSENIMNEHPNIYGEMRNAEIRLTQRLLTAASDTEIRDALLGKVLEGIHVESILGLGDESNLDEFITIYGEKGGSELSIDTILTLFGENVRNLYQQYKDNEDENEKEELRGRIISGMKEKISIDHKDGARDGIVKIIHDDGTEYPLFTIKNRTRPIGTSPIMEMAQTNYMSNSLKHGLDMNQWPPVIKNNFYKKQIKEIENDLDGSFGDERELMLNKLQDLKGKLV
tara:strand:- start:1874 stop:3892 length:2019 start_codon:yes stop_codon:yes gene_type:complete